MHNNSALSCAQESIHWMNHKLHLVHTYKILSTVRIVILMLVRKRCNQNFDRNANSHKFRRWIHQLSAVYIALQLENELKPIWRRVHRPGGSGIQSSFLRPVVNTFTSHISYLSKIIPSLFDFCLRKGNVNQGNIVCPFSFSEETGKHESRAL